MYPLNRNTTNHRETKMSGYTDFGMGNSYVVIDVPRTTLPGFSTQVHLYDVPRVWEELTSRDPNNRYTVSNPQPYNPRLRNDL